MKVITLNYERLYSNLCNFSSDVRPVLQAILDKCRCPFFPNNVDFRFVMQKFRYVNNGGLTIRKDHESSMQLCYYSYVLSSAQEYEDLNDIRPCKYVYLTEEKSLELFDNNTKYGIYYMDEISDKLSSYTFINMPDYVIVNDDAPLVKVKCKNLSLSCSAESVFEILTYYKAYSIDDLTDGCFDAIFSIPNPFLCQLHYYGPCDITLPDDHDILHIICHDPELAMKHNNALFYSSYVKGTLVNEQHRLFSKVSAFLVSRIKNKEYVDFDEILDCCIAIKN